MRIQAMRESLERIGRFDPQRARDRFLSSFEPSECKFILIDGVSVGFVVVRLVESQLLLDHLYVVPEHQKKGIGSAVLGSVLKDADTRSVAVKLGALRDSDSNRFYQRHGFVKLQRQNGISTMSARPCHGSRRIIAERLVRTGTRDRRAGQRQTKFALYLLFALNS
jgi:GNAT superfamily N-acetyltransferase